VRLTVAACSSFFSFLECRFDEIRNPFRGSRAKPASTWTEAVIPNAAELKILQAQGLSHPRCSAGPGGREGCRAALCGDPPGDQGGRAGSAQAVRPCDFPAGPGPDRGRDERHTREAPHCLAENETRAAMPTAHGGRADRRGLLLARPAACLRREERRTRPGVTAGLPRPLEHRRDGAIP
jgi:hypothetical protein